MQIILKLNLMKHDTIINNKITENYSINDAMNKQKKKATYTLFKNIYIEIKSHCLCLDKCS